MGPGNASAHKFVGCPVIFPVSGTFQVSVTLTAPDDLDKSNNSLSKQFQVAPYASALPDALGRLFAGLGMFAAMMLIMALGTEAVIDSFKVMLGLKSKVTAGDALAEMEKLLPGKLAALGVNAASQVQVENLIKDMREKIKPLEDTKKEILEISRNINDEKISVAFKQLVVLDQSGTSLTGLENLKAAARKVVESLELETAEKKLGLPKGFTDKSRGQLLAKINAITLADAGNVTETVFGILRDLGQKTLDEQVKQTIDQGRDAVKNVLNEIKPELEKLGLRSAELNAAENRILATVDAVDAKLVATTDSHLEGLRNLLDGVEDRRYQTQSPLRKLWRRLRTANAIFGTGIVALVAASALVIFFNRSWGSGDFFDLKKIPLPQSVDLFWFTLIGIGVLAVLTYVVIWLLGQIGKCFHDIPPGKYTDLLGMEILWNILRGEGNVDPDDYDKPRPIEEIAKVENLTAKNAAKVVLELDDKHRDQEDSRLRWLRALSVLVGFVLAYLLQMDAAKLLDAAVPDLSKTINFFHWTGENLHKFWVVLPATLDLTPGIILTGLASSAGSTFWHDQLDRLQATKKSAEAAATLLQQAKQAVRGESQ